VTQKQNWNVHRKRIGRSVECNKTATSRLVCLLACLLVISKRPETSAARRKAVAEVSVDVDSVCVPLHQVDVASSFRVEVNGVGKCSCTYRFLFQQNQGKGSYGLVPGPNNDSNRETLSNGHFKGHTKKLKAMNNWRSQAVIHPSVPLSRCCLTSSIMGQVT
jgi:hypothetical protein